MAKRLLVVLVLLPIGIALIALGGPVFTLAVAAILSVAASEYARLFSRAGYAPSYILVIGGSALLALLRGGLLTTPPWVLDAVLVALTLVAMAVHVLAYERGRDQAPVDFAITLAGILYLGWVGSYLAALRHLPDGQWWFLLVLPAVWIADSAAFQFGTMWGKHKISRRVSPRKSWEGYIAGIIAGTIAGALLGALWHNVSPTITPAAGALIGFILSAVTILGDLGESMIKRMANQKDSSTLLPGHGGVFDRIDSWIWAAAIGYYLIMLF
jgi:phosphatidate cytidylyltransferase